MNIDKKEAFALLINDIHVSKNNIPEFNANWEEALSVCHKYGIERIIIGGDLWQSRSSQTLSTILAVKDALTKATDDGITVVIAEGNHDKVNQESVFGYGHIFSEYPDIFAVQDYAIFRMKRASDITDLYVMSYFPENGSFVERYLKMCEALNPSHKSVLYIHQGIKGGISTASDDELPASLFENFDCVLVGHYHDRNIVKGTNIEYIGASRQHNFGEDEEKGYTIIYTDGSYEFVKNQVNNRYKTINTSFNDIVPALFDNIRGVLRDNRYRIRIKVYCLSAQVSLIDKQKFIDCGVSKVEIVTEKSILSSSAFEQTLSEKYDKNGIKQEYVNFCSDKEIDNVDLGLSYLDKITNSDYVATK